jgi:hypothetical protein
MALAIIGGVAPPALAYGTGSNLDCPPPYGEFEQTASTTTGANANADVTLTGSATLVFWVTGVALSNSTDARTVREWGTGTFGSGTSNQVSDTTATVVRFDPPIRVYNGVTFRARSPAAGVASTSYASVSYDARVVSVCTVPEVRVRATPTPLPVSCESGCGTVELDTTEGSFLDGWRDQTWLASGLLLFFVAAGFYVRLAK